MFKAILNKYTVESKLCIAFLVLVMSSECNLAIAQNTAAENFPLAVELLISDKNVNKLNQKRILALYDNHLYTTDDDWVNAKFIFNNDTLPAEVRLKGDYLDHWYNDKVWSFKVKLKGEYTFLGMKKFALQHPKTRGYINEWLFHKLLKNNELIYLRYDFVKMAVNGEEFPNYAVEENFDKYLIENNELREGLIFQLSNRYYWAMNRSLKNEVDPIDAFFGAEMLPYGESSVLKNPVLKQHLKLSRTLITGFQNETLTTTEVFDKEKLATFLALLDLTGYHHASNNDNVKFYFNPVTNYIEPIGYDNQKIADIREQGLLGEKKELNNTANIKSPSKNDYYMNRVQYQLWFKDSVFYEAYINKLYQLVSEQKTKDLLNRLQPEIKSRELFLKKIDNDYVFEGDKTILQNIKTIKDSILTLKKTDILGKFKINTQQLTVELINHKTLPIKVNAIIVDGDTIVLKSNNILQPNTNQQFSAHFEIPVLRADVQKVNIITSLYGLPDIEKTISLQKDNNIALQENLNAIVPVTLKQDKRVFEAKDVSATKFVPNQFIDKEISGAQVYFKSYSKENQTLTLTIVNVTQNWIEVLDARYYDKWQFEPLNKTYIAPSKATLAPNCKDVVFKVPEIQSEFQAKKNLHFPWKKSMLDEIKVRYKNPESASNKLASIYSWPYYSDKLLEANIIRKKSNLTLFPFIKLDTLTKTIVFSKGTHNVATPLKIPTGFKVICNEETTLNLINSAYIVSFSPFYFTGTKEKPIQFTSSDNSGMGLIVYHTNEPSQFDYVLFNNQKAINHAGLTLTGMINFYESNVEFNNCTFANNNSEDILNIIRSNYIINDCLFKDVFSDALDCDFSNGTISRTTFEKIGNDAIDISGQSADINQVTITNAGDKGISAGEKSTLTGNNITIHQAAIAISAKDLSSISIGKLTVTDSNLDYAVFQKKSEYGPAKVVIENTKKKNNYLLETNSTLIINAKPMDKLTPDVGDLLYGNVYGKSSK